MTEVFFIAMLVVLAIGVLMDVVVAKNNTSRINRLERDVTYLMSTRGVNPRPVEPPPENTTLETKLDPTYVAENLKQAHVADKKAYRAADLAVKNGWVLLDIQDNIKMVRFMKAQNGDVQKVNIYYGGKGGKRELYTVATALNHPTKGKTQLFRKFITEAELEELLKNPRKHTQKGYYRGGE